MIVPIVLLPREFSGTIIKITKSGIIKSISPALICTSIGQVSRAGEKPPANTPAYSPSYGASGVQGHRRR